MITRISFGLDVVKPQRLTVTMHITVCLCGISVFPKCVHSLQKPFIMLTNRARKSREMERN